MPGAGPDPGALNVLESEAIVSQLGSVIHGGLQVNRDKLIKGKHLLHVIQGGAGLRLKVSTPAFPLREAHSQLSQILAARRESPALPVGPLD